MPEQSTRAIQLMPNPASELLRVQGIYDASTPYQIYDIYGKAVDSGRLGDGRIPIARLASGVYYLKLATKQNNRNLLRFVKAE